ncbi:NAD(P)-binding protein [Eremomyces bilateralis CBS 781.70]|uniref:NAD(P)-binding protein n=1 Tax=Eremomyces bilateralis CBS 781.70 TaxID=1392243 RepID=A0A6G1FV07_9PEZI|nr:NAD(P)-binding protein [Eremomyces bilateralis CBS 781.70]KAF1809512.1 NAD(P)-binding protein [Eremomyces bilateralis CBS 781.70]
MVHVALAGATRNFGLTLVKTIVETGKHEVTVISRTPQPEISALGVHVHAVNYDDHEALVKALTGVHTVISTIAASGDVFRTSQLALLAAAQAAHVTRFAPSEFAISQYEGFDLYAPKIPVWDAVKASGLEYTRFTCGIFMNAFATGTPKGEEVALAGLRAWNFVVNVRAGTADMPGRGEERVTFTEIGDVCRFVAGALELEGWEEEMGMVGETTTWGEVVGKIEKVTGRKVLVKRNSIGEMTKLAEEPAVRFYNQVRIGIAEGKFEVEPTLNRLVDSVSPVSIEEFLEKWWSGVELGEAKWGEDKIFALV